MIPEGVEIIPGETYRHDQEHGGLLYRVNSLGPSTEDYELTQRVGAVIVNYTQLEQGGCPPGSIWHKSETAFRRYFTPEPQV